MSTIITKYNDYVIHGIPYFIDKIETELAIRDIKGIFNNKVEMINVTKQHPIVSLMAAQLQENKSLDAIRSSVLPAIAVTPSNPTEDGFTMGQGFQTAKVDDAFIDNLKTIYNMTMKDRVQEGILTNLQIETIMSTYKKSAAGAIRAQINEWRKNEEINISIWADSVDYDDLLSIMLESMLADIQVGFAGDDSPVRNMKWRVTRGLTNFNFGRVLFGSEYSLTFLNTYNNYTIYSDDVISGHDFIGTFEIPGGE
jgi:hypothetical protein